MGSEEGRELLGVFLKWDLVVSLVGVKDGVPSLTTWEGSDLLPGSSFWIAWPDAVLVQSTEVNTKTNLVRAFLWYHNDWV